MKNINKYLIVVVGPTAVGKTALCIEIAKKYQTEIISADSRQFFQEMSIGTAKPTKEDLASAKHHFIDNLSIHQPYSAGQFEKDALALIYTLFEKKDLLVMTGGSGMYIDAVCKGFDDLPDVDSEVRQQLNAVLENEGLPALVAQLKQLDPVYYDQVDKANPQRVVRALEICIGTGRPYSSFRNSTQNVRDFQIIKLGLERDREELYHRIDLRMDIMIEEGLFEEAERLYNFRHHNALQTVGYKEIFDFMEGAYDKQEAIRLLKRNSRRYAKRQLTWFKRDEEITWFKPDQIEEIFLFLEKKIGNSGD